jgi:cytosine/uracil/thiamine/allantoin permease
MWNQKATLSGSAYSWGFLASLTSVIGNYATLSVNQVRCYEDLTPECRD